MGGGSPDSVGDKGDLGGRGIKEEEEYKLYSDHEYNNEDDDV